MAKQAITLKIAGKSYPFQIESGKEEMYRLAEREVNSYLTLIKQQNIRNWTDQDYLSMTALKFAIANVGMRQSRELDSEDLRRLEAIGNEIDACLNDPTLVVYDSFFGDSLTLTLPLLYSAYRLDLFQEGYEVGSHSFSYYSPMEVPPDTLEITASSFGLEVKRGDVPLESLRAFLLPGQGNGDPIELEIVPRDGSSRLYLAMEGLSSGTSYTLQIVDRSRETTVYLSYSFVTLTS